MNPSLRFIKLCSRLALALVWIYEGLIPKILFVRADELDLIERSGIFWRNSATTLHLLGFAQIALGLWLLAGFAERTAVALATIAMLVLVVLVAATSPAMLTEPYGALVKDFCLLACAITVWQLAKK